MAHQQHPPLDEIAHSRPEIIDWHMMENHGQPMDENMIYRYLDASPFMDSSKNQLIFGQSQTNWHYYTMVANRKRFEDTLKAQKGLEYMIVGEPQPVPGGPKVENGVGGNGMWVIRKQERNIARFQDKKTGNVKEEVDLAVMGTYWINGINMFQAPSIGDVIGCRLISAANHLSKLYDTASKLPTYDPERGYYYLPASSNTQKATASTAGSAAGSPARSREGSVVAGETQSLRSASLLPDSNQSTAHQASEYRQAALLADSFKNTLEFADDFMDENPLIGEPGSFTYTHSTQAVKKRRAEIEAEIAALEAAAKTKQSQLNSKVATPAGKPPSPPAIMTEKAVKDLKDQSKERRGSKMEGKKARKKSRGYSLAPSTPASAGTGSGPNSAV